MAGEFGNFIDRRRRSRAADGSDVMLKDIAAEMGISASYLSDIMKGRRSLPNREGLDVVVRMLRLSPDEVDEMMDTVGREREQAAPDLPEYIMSEDLPNVRVALRKAKSMNKGNDFWQRVVDELDDGT
jgi:transcriptional regulator with XRE-family HTH domain